MTADGVSTAGGYDVAPVRVLGIPVLSVATPVVSRDAGLPDARQRVNVIEGNLAMLCAPHGLCSGGE